MREKKRKIFEKEKEKKYFSISFLYEFGLNRKKNNLLACVWIKNENLNKIFINKT